MSNEKCSAVSSTTLTMAMAYKHGGFFGSVPNVPAQAATFEDEVITHEVLQVLIVQHHINLVSGCQQYRENSRHLLTKFVSPGVVPRRLSRT